MVVKSKVKYIKGLGEKKQRDDNNVFVAEGPKIINELLAEPSLLLQELYALKTWVQSGAVPSGIDVTEVDEMTLGRLSFLKTPNKVIGVFKKPVLPPLTLTGNMALALDNIQDPGNLGTIIRCADWFGIKNIVCSMDCVDVYNPKTVQSTMGSIARVNVYYEELMPLMRKNRDVKVYATTLDGKSISDVKPFNEGLIVIGNESQGVREEIVSIADEKITIPRKGKAESLNAAIATGIILSHISISIT
jgi:RNA methyltransferase, TrmH family